MRPRHRNRRLGIFILCAAGVIFGAFLLLKALQDNKQFFKHPSDVLHESFVQGEREIRIGGLVEIDSIKQGDGLNVEFGVVDFIDDTGVVQSLTVRYDKVLPDLFREGQGVVVTGKLSEDGVFIANNVLAKHDENYMPRMPDKVSSLTISE